MPLIPFPDVPKYPGVPNVIRTPGANPDISGVIASLRSGSPLGVLQSVVSTQWGIYYPDGGLAIAADSVISLDYSVQSFMADFPIETGGFAVYNKVLTPYTVTVALVKEFSLLPTSITAPFENRSTFLDSLDELQHSPTAFVDVVTPDAVYSSVQLIGYDYSRSSSSNATMITVNAQFQQVRVTGDAIQNPTATPEGAGIVDKGFVAVKKFFGG